MRRLALGLLLACYLWPPVGAASEFSVLTQPARQGSQALHAVLLDVTRAGDRLVAVGERGIVLLSDDNGQYWMQARVPVSSTLTAVQFVDAQQGWAVGHAGVVLYSRDAGQSWTLQMDGNRAAALELAAAEAAGDPQRVAAAQRLVADGADKPLLAVYFSDALHGWVVGAYGLALESGDGGQSWQSIMGRLPNPRGLHLYAMAGQGQTLYVMGEQGVLLRSVDGGQQFTTLSSPYEGSLFAGAVQANGRLLIGGLRGKLFASDDQGATFAALANPLPVSINGIRVLGQRVLLVNAAGMLLQSGLDRFAAQPLPVTEGQPLTAITEAADGALVSVGVTGPLRLPTAPQPQPNAE